MADRVELPLDGFGDPKGPDKRIALSEDAISPRADDVTSPSFLQRELPPPRMKYTGARNSRHWRSQ